MRKQYVYGQRSLIVISEVHFLLGYVALGALAILNRSDDGIDISFTDGARTKAEAKNYAVAGTGSENSKHIPHPSDGKARAIDGQPAGKDPFPRPSDSPVVVKQKMDAFRIYRGAMLEAADRLELVTLDNQRVYVRSGSDWNCEGTETQLDPEEKAMRLIPDFPHIELVFPGERRYEAARQARMRRINARHKGERWPL